MCFHSLVTKFTELLSIVLLDDFILSENLIVTVLQLIYDTISAELGVIMNIFISLIFLNNIILLCIYPVFVFILFWVLSLLW